MSSPTIAHVLHALIVTRSTVAEFVVTRRKDGPPRSEEHTSELQSRGHLVCRLLLEKKKKKKTKNMKTQPQKNITRRKQHEQTTNQNDTMTKHYKITIYKTQYSLQSYNI